MRNPFRRLRPPQSHQREAVNITPSPGSNNDSQQPPGLYLLEYQGCRRTGNHHLRHQRRGRNMGLMDGECVDGETDSI
jgi:hypothetical protein